MISVGLTGGIGSGKSTVARLFSVLEVPVYDSDERAKYVMNNHPELINGIKLLLGEESYNKTGLNNAFIAQKIFSDLNLRNSLNKLVHEIVFQDYDIYKELNFDKSYIIMESAILFEGGYDKIHHYMITVFSPEEIRIKRLKAKGMSEDEISKRMQSQWADEEKIKRADFVIINDEKKSVLNQVMEIHNKILVNYL